MTGHVKTFDKNLKGRDFFCTDVHGHFDLLHQELSNVSFDGRFDRLFVGGDNVDRHPDSKYIVDYIYEPWYHSIMGNHCKMLCNFYENPFSRVSYEMFFCNGGDWFFEETMSPVDKEAIYIALKDLPLGIEFESRSGKKIGIVHAEVWRDDWEAFKNATEYDLEWEVEAFALWSRRRYDRKEETVVKNIDEVYVGHTPTKSGNVEQLGNVFYCDAGSFFRNKLNLIEIL